MSSPSLDTQTLKERLGDLQALAASICQSASSKQVRRTFSQFSELIFHHFGVTRKTLLQTCNKCKDFLEPYHVEVLVNEAPECESDIRQVFSEVDELHEMIILQ